MRTAMRQDFSFPRWASWLVPVVIWCSLSGSAHAATATIVESREDGAPPAEQAKLRGAVEKALQALQIGLIPLRDVESVIAGEAQLQGCYSELCFERLGRLLDSQLVVHFRAKPLAPAGKKPGLKLSIALFDGEVGALGARLEEQCLECTESQAADKLGELTRRAVLQSAGRPRGVLEVYSQPAGAAVFVDGTELGITPYKRAAFAGKHKVVLGHIGYRSEQRETEVTQGAPHRVEVTLVLGSEPTTATVEKTPVYKKWWFWVAIGGAAVAATAITVGVVVGTSAPGRAVQAPPNTLTVSF